MLWVSGKADGHRQGELIASDSVTIPYREWWRSDAKAVIVYLHGQGDHSGPFTAMGDLLHEMGHNLYAGDHRGFGLSPADRGDIATYDLFIADALTVVEHARAKNPGLPLFLLGLSMGGHLALRTAYRAHHLIRGVIALSPGFKLRTAPSWLVVLKTVLSAIFTPKRCVESAAGTVMTTRNQLHVDRSLQDEHYVTSFTGRFYVEAVKSIRKAKRELTGITVPVLMMQAGDDFLICPEESRRFFDRIGHPDKEFRLLEGLCHNLVVEPEMPQITKEIASWIAARVRPNLRVVR
jgi:alpha-beta hydrolase superfamily lysophospholipase